jgi:hypothetical protein
MSEFVVEFLFFFNWKPAPIYLKLFLSISVSHFFFIQNFNGIFKFSNRNGFPKQIAAQTILRSINSYFRNLKATGAVSTLISVFFVLYDKESVGIYTSELSKLDINAD